MMKISPASAISRLSVRFGERRRQEHAPQDAEPEITPTDDERKIRDFSLLVLRVSALLDEEHDAYRAGDVVKVSGYADRKAGLLEDLLQAQPSVEHLLAGETAGVPELRGHVRDLSDKINRNADMLRGMTDASLTIISEVDRIRRGQSLDGVYDKTGNRREEMASPGGRIVRNL